MKPQKLKLPFAALSLASACVAGKDEPQKRIQHILVSKNQINATDGKLAFFAKMTEKAIFEGGWKMPKEPILIRFPKQLPVAASSTPETLTIENGVADLSTETDLQPRLFCPVSLALGAKNYPRIKRALKGIEIDNCCPGAFNQQFLRQIIGSYAKGTSIVLSVSGRIDHRGEGCSILIAYPVDTSASGVKYKRFNCFNVLMPVRVKPPANPAKAYAPRAPKPKKKH